MRSTAEPGWLAAGTPGLYQHGDPEEGGGDSPGKAAGWEGHVGLRCQADEALLRRLHDKWGRKGEEVILGGEGR